MASNGTCAFCGEATWGGQAVIVEDEDGKRVKVCVDCAEDSK